MLKLNLFQNSDGRSMPKSESRMGSATVVHPDAVYADPSIGPGIVLPDIPDFAAMADEQCQVIDSYAVFHESAVGFFTPKLDEEAVRYCRELHRVYGEYESHLNTTYRAALTDELERVKCRLASMPGVRIHIESKNHTDRKTCYLKSRGKPEIFDRNLEK